MSRYIDFRYYFNAITVCQFLKLLDVCCPVKELSPIKEFTFRLNVPAGKSVHYELLNASAQHCHE